MSARDFPFCARPGDEVANGWGFWHGGGVSTLAEVEQAAAKLARDDQKQLLRFLLRILPINESELAEPRLFSDEEIQSWLAEDEASMRRFRPESVQRKAGTPNEGAARAQ